MVRSEAVTGHTGRAVVVSGLGGVAVVVGAAQGSISPAVWGLLGWGLMTAIGLAAGSWMAREHGLPGSGFLTAMVVGILARLAAAAVGAAMAARAVEGTPWAYLAGLAVGYLPLQMFEVAWFARGGSVTTDHAGAGRPAVRP